LTTDLDPGTAASFACSVYAVLDFPTADEAVRAKAPKLRDLVDTSKGSVLTTQFVTYVLNILRQSIERVARAALRA
jgi:hypothetical protein